MKGRIGSVINSWVRIILDNEVGKNVFVMLGMGMLSLMMGELKFSFPGIEGAESDFRTLIVFISVFYFPRWYYLIAVSFIASLTTSAEGSLIITFLMHSVASVFLFFCYKLLLTRIISYFSQALLWAILVVFSYLFIVFAILVAASASIGLIVSDSLMDTYLSTVSSGRYEIVVTSITSALVYYSRKIRLQLFNSKEELLESKTRAEESDALKTSFLQNMSHEIRTPLNIISSGVHLLLQKQVDKARQKWLKLV